MIQEATQLQKSGDLSALALKTSLDEARSVAALAMAATDAVNDENRVSRTLFINNMFIYGSLCCLLFIYLVEN